MFKYLRNQRGEVVSAVAAIFFIGSLIMWGVIGHQQRERGIAEGNAQCSSSVTMQADSAEK